MRHWVVLVLFLLMLGTLRIVACGDESCVEDQDCNDGNPCTSDRCPEPPLFDVSLCDGDGQTCQHSPKADGTPCDPGKVCVDGVCGENLCEGVVCDDGLACTVDTCVFKNGTCDFGNLCNDFDDCTENICTPLDGSCDFTTPVEDGTRCEMWEPLPLYGLGTCEDGVCAGPCDLMAKEELQCPVSGFEWLSCCPGFEFCLSTDPEEPCPENLCEGVVCNDDGNPCTRNYCDIRDGECHADDLHGQPCKVDSLSGICSWDVCEVQSGTGGTGGAGGGGGIGGFGGA